MLKIYQNHPNENAIAQVVKLLEQDAIVIYPTDSVYAFGCSAHSAKAIERIKNIKGKKAAELAVVCDSLSMVADYCRVDNPTFKILKTNLPGAFTFILKASSRLPERALGRRKTIGVRIPSNPIPIAIVEALGHPMITTSVRPDENWDEYTVDPELIEERWGHAVALVVDGGPGDNTPTTVVDLSEDEPEIIRQGRAELVY